MLEEQLTKEKFGYFSSELTIKSNKKIVVRCDYCNQIYESTKKRRAIGSEVVDKDACVKCRYRKREEISLKRDGVKNSAQRSDVKKKLCDYDIEEYKEQVEQLTQEGWSVAIIAEKLSISPTSLHRAMTKWGFTTKGNLQKKKEKTLVDKYGNGYRQKMNEAFRKTSVEKYGYDNPFQNEEIKEKIRQTHLDKRGVDHHLKLPETKQLVKEKTYATKLAKGQIRLYDGKKISELATECGFSRSHFNSLVNKYGFEHAITLTPRETQLERDFAIFLDKEQIEYEKQFRVGKKLADFRIGNLIIELDGLYWHSDAVIGDKLYHVTKRQIYLDHGFTPLFFREDELRDKIPIIKSILFNKLGRSKRIFARNCDIRQLTTQEANNFFFTNHLMGKGSGVAFGLFYKGTLVCAIRIRRNLDISRFASLLNTTVVGGFSKLCRRAMTVLRLNQLSTFIDLRYGNGTYLTNLGFTCVNTDLSFRWTDGLNSYHRLRFRGNSGYDYGLVKIWDCGQARWELVT